MRLNSPTDSQHHLQFVAKRCEGGAKPEHDVCGSDVTQSFLFSSQVTQSEVILWYCNLSLNYDSKKEAKSGQLGNNS
jgi:hypothetical protein